jgi:hypothetical protein
MVTCELWRPGLDVGSHLSLGHFAVEVSGVALCSFATLACALGCGLAGGQMTSWSSLVSVLDGVRDLDVRSSKILVNIAFIIRLSVSISSELYSHSHITRYINSHLSSEIKGLVLPHDSRLPPHLHLHGGPTCSGWRHNPRQGQGEERNEAQKGA